jgi:hypothetical protein
VVLIFVRLFARNRRIEAARVVVLQVLKPKDLRTSVVAMTSALQGSGENVRHAGLEGRGRFTEIGKLCRPRPVHPYILSIRFQVEWWEAIRPATQELIEAVTDRDTHVSRAAIFHPGVGPLHHRPIASKIEAEARGGARQVDCRWELRQPNWTHIAESIHGRHLCVSFANLNVYGQQ